MYFESQESQKHNSFTNFLFPILLLAVYTVSQNHNHHSVSNIQTICKQDSDQTSA